MFVKGRGYIYENLTGLTSKEALTRITNGNCNIPSKSVGQIIRTNTLTFFNLLNIILGIVVFMTGEYKNMMFLGVILFNTIIGIFQEIRAKRMIDRLSLLSAAKARVIRDGEIREISTDLLVQDDVIILSEGMQIPADCEVMRGELEVNESMITGESDPIIKKAGDELLSGSFVICGEAAAILRKVGEESFAYSIMKGAKYLKKTSSHMQKSVNRLIKGLTVIIIPVAVGLFIKSIFNDAGNDINSAVAAIIGMIPQGLILLISVVMAISVIRLSKHKALARDMYCAEILARVDIMCLDKTGTLTTGEMSLEEIIPLNGSNVNEIRKILFALMQVLPDKNPTAAAVRHHVGDALYGAPKWFPEKITPFSSSRKYSSVTFKDRGTYVLGASETPYNNKRTLSLTHDGKLLALLTIGDEIRPETRKTLRFFDKQGVSVKIISGDNPLTVQNIAIEAGVKNAEKIIDMTGFNGDYTKIAESCVIFGRVTPAQKLELVKALRKKHTVAMVGDGVNDVLPLKEADCSVAMQSGSEAARNVASLVLFDNNFASLPKAVLEGRRSINNLERSAALFLTKTVYSLVLAVVYLFLISPYPFIPIQMTLINGLFIGLPSFILALEKNNRLVRGSFLSNVLTKAVPYGLCGVIGISLLAFFSFIFNFTDEETRTAATIILGVASFAVLCRICRPINKKKLALIAFSGLLFSLAIQFFDNLLSVAYFTREMHIVAFLLCALMLPACIFLPKFAERFIKSEKK